MTTYKYYDEGAEAAYQEPGRALFHRRINIATIIANGVNGGLADSDGDRTALPSTGFAQNDILEVFQVPLGTLILQAGIRIKTAMTNSGTATIGMTDTTTTLPAGASAAGWLASVSLAATGTKITLVSDAYGPDNYAGVLTVADTSIDLKFTGAVNHNDGVFDLWALGFRVYES